VNEGPNRLEAGLLLTQKRDETGQLAQTGSQGLSAKRP
jgi:hypothetical protein